jgi:hypothetical protein
MDWINWNEYIIQAFPKNVSNEVIGILDILPYNRKVIVNFRGEKIEIIPKYQNGKFFIQDKMFDFNDIKYDFGNYENRDLTYNFIPFSVRLNKEYIKIPYRIYINEVEDETIQDLNEIQKTILYCLYSRHYNGFVRQKYIKKLLYKNDRFIAPYIIQIIGENISEIMEGIDKYIDINVENVTEFLAYNLYFWKDIKGKVQSNWNLFQREKYPVFKEYIGRILEKKIDKIYDDFCKKNKIKNEINDYTLKM